MPERGDDLENRVQRLEDEVTRLQESVAVSRSDAAAARILAGGADRDVADMKALLRAHTQTLNALRETQLEQHGQLTSLDTRVTSLDAKIDMKVDELRSEMQQGFGMVHTGIAQITALIRGIDERGES
jgi:chromosome segregation ATPase